MGKTILLGDEARDRVMEGVRKLSNAVKVTLGPSGRNVLLEGKNSPVVTNDGVTIAREIDLSDPVENIGCQLLKNAAMKTDAEVGDGTTTTIVIAEHFLEHGMDGIDIDEIIERLKERATPIKIKKDKERVAKISCQDDDMAKAIADVMQKMGDDVSIVIEEQDDSGISYETIKGYQLNKGGENKEIHDCIILLHTKKLFSPHALYKEFEVIGNKPCLLIADMEDEVRDFLIKNNKKGTLDVTIVDLPDNTKDLEGIKHASKVRIEENKTTIFTDDGNDLAIIKLGADSDLEYTEKFHRLTDALNATKQAVKHGVIKGGGLVLAELGINTPLHTIASNMDIAPHILVEKIVKNKDVLDPVSVTIAALKNAASVAATFLTTEVIVYEDKVE